MRKWKLIDTKVLCRSDFVSMFDDEVMLPSGQEITYTKVELRDFVSVLPFTDSDDRDSPVSQKLFEP